MQISLASISIPVVDSRPNTRPPPAAYRSGSWATTTWGTATSIAIDYPAGLVASDLVVLTVRTPFTDGVATIPGFTERYHIDDGTNATWRVFTGTGFSGSGSWTVDWVTASTTSQRVVMASAFSDVDQANIIYGTTRQENSSSAAIVTWNGITTVAPGLNVALLSAAAGNGVLSDVSPAHTLRVPTPTPTSGWNHQRILTTRDETPGATGNVTATVNAWNTHTTIYIGLPDIPTS